MHEPREQAGQTPLQQTMEEMHDILASELPPEISTELVRMGQGVRLGMTEGATYITRQADGMLGRPTRLPNNYGMTLDTKTDSVDVTQGKLGGFTIYSHNQSGTTDIVTGSVTPKEVHERVERAASDPAHGGVLESTARILGSTEINGRPVAQVEQRLFRGGDFGFGQDPRLGQGEDLLQRLAEDNEVVEDGGYTHQQMAEPLETMLTAWNETSRSGQPREGQYNGRTYALEADTWREPEFSEFTGEEMTRMLVRATDVETGASLQFDGLSIIDIRSHGFYGGAGEGVKRRNSPGAIATVFNLQPQQQQVPASAE